MMGKVRTARRYNWESILSRSQKLVRNKHYNGFSYTFAVQLRRAAKKYRVKISVRVSEQSIVLTVLSRQRKKVV